jgi:hypothetical protein
MMAEKRRQSARQGGGGDDDSFGGGDTTTSSAALVPQSLQQQRNIDAILRTADEVQQDDPQVARICKLCLQACIFSHHLPLNPKPLLLLLAFPPNPKPQILNLSFAFLPMLNLLCFLKILEERMNDELLVSSSSSSSLLGCVCVCVNCFAVCEYAYSLSQHLDPKDEGRGVLQFKTGLLSIIKVISSILKLGVFFFSFFSEL